MPGVMIIETDNYDTVIEEMLEDPAKFRKRAWDDARREVTGSPEDASADEAVHPVRRIPIQPHP